MDYLDIDDEEVEIGKKQDKQIVKGGYDCYFINYFCILYFLKLELTEYTQPDSRTFC